MAKLGDTVFHHIHDDDERVDRIEIEVIPRYKTSGLSGDEWRVSARVRFHHKGELVWERSYGDMDYAARALPMLVKTWMSEEGDYQIHSHYPFNHDPARCDQPGCAEVATTTYQLKHRYGRQGDAIPEKYGWTYVTRFCARHARRGDAGLEDSDRNYIVLSGPGPTDHAMAPEDESPAVFGGVIEAHRDGGDGR